MSNKFSAHTQLRYDDRNHDCAHLQQRAAGGATAVRLRRMCRAASSAAAVLALGATVLWGRGQSHAGALRHRRRLLCRRCSVAAVGGAGRGACQGGAAERRRQRLLAEGVGGEPRLDRRAADATGAPGHPCKHFLGLIQRVCPVALEQRGSGRRRQVLQLRVLQLRRLLRLLLLSRRGLPAVLQRCGRWVHALLA